MRLVVTGGGTGGHIYPALEVAQAARNRDWTVQYFGSFRGQEAKACERVGIPITQFDSQPLYSLKTPNGWKAALKLWKASRQAAQQLRAFKADAVFATGGYAAAPVLYAAKKLGVPVVVHEQNTVPGRTNLMMAQHASAVCTVFEKTAEYFPREKVVRTGMPIRPQLRDSAQGQLFEAGMAHPAPTVLVVGGSQGSAALNDAALATAVRMARCEVQWIHITGPSQYESTLASRNKLAIKSEYTVHPYLQADEMAAAMFNCTLCVGRSGAGILAELAAFRKPSILVPFPSAFGDHQTHNAEEFVRLGAADLLPQSEMSASALEGRILRWLEDDTRRTQAERALEGWDIPDAVDRVLAELDKLPVSHA